jgi:hypothetical protein
LAAPKRKRPRVRTRPEEGVVPAQAGVIAANTVVVNSSIPVAAAAPAAVREVDQIEDHPVGVITEEGSLKTEAATTAAPVSGPGPASSSPSGSLLVAAAPSMRQNSTVERKHEKAEKKIAKGEVTKTTSNEKKPSSAPPLDIKPVPIKLAGPTTTGMQEVDATTVSSPLPVDSPNKKDLAKRSVAQPAPTADDGRVNKFNIDLMALSSKAALPLSSERNDNATGTQGEEVQEKPLVWQCPKLLSFRVHELTVYRLDCGLIFFICSIIYCNYLICANWVSFYPGGCECHSSSCEWVD